MMEHNEAHLTGYGSRLHMRVMGHGFFANYLQSCFTSVKMAHQEIVQYIKRKYRETATFL